MIRFFKIFFLSMVLLVIGLYGFWKINGNLEGQSQGANKDQKLPFTDGYYSRYYSTGELKSEEFLMSGMKHGVWKYFYKNGKLKSRIPYYKDQIEGKISHYHSNGELIYQEAIINGKLISKKIFNDSLYKYEISAYLHGKTLFETSCDNCHSVGNINRTELDSLTNFLSNNSTMGFIPKDSIHSLYGSSSFEIQQGKKQYSAYDLHSISQFIETTKPKKYKIYRLRKIKPIGL